MICQHTTNSGTPCKYVSKTVYDGKHLCKRHLDVIKSGEDCALCLCEMEGRKDKIRLHCGHYYHRSCLSQVQKAECPLCREVMSSTECIAVFDKTVIKPILTDLFNTPLTIQATVMSVIRSALTIARYPFEPNYYVSCIAYVCSIIESSYIAPSSMNTILVMMSNATAHVKRHGSLDGFTVVVHSGGVME